ncbi:MAG: FkbM family methyltransferase [Candidatus Paceibacteria bacterium]
MKTIINTVPKLAWELSGHSILATLILSCRLSYFYITRYYWPAWGDFSITVYVTRKAQLFTLHSFLDVAGLAEAFVDKEYSFDGIDEVKTILDIGGHIGDSTLYFRMKYPKVTIFVVEPATETLKYLRKNFANDDKVKIIQGALAATSGYLELQITKNSMGHSLKSRSSGVGHETVKTHTLSDICSLAGVSKFDITKFDIEGGEDALLSIKPNTYSRAYIGEIHLDLLPGVSLEDYKTVFKDASVTFTNTKHQKRYIMRALYA